MAYALIQSNHDKTVNSITFPGAVTAGSLLIFGSCYDGGGQITAVSGGGTWVKIGSEQLDGTNNQRGSFWYCANATGGATTVTPTVSGSYLARTLVIAEYSGVATSTPLDTQDTTHSFTATTTTGTDAEASNNITPAGAGELIVVHFVDTGGNQGSISPGTGFTAGPVELGTGGLTGANGLAWKSGGAGSQNGTFTVGTAGHRYAVQIAAFLTGSGGGTQAITPSAITSTSAMSGAVQKLAAVKPAAITATSAMSGAVQALKQVKPSAITSTSAVSGTVTKLGTKAIVPAAITSTSTVTGVVVKLASVRPSAINATSFLSGTVSGGTSNANPLRTLTGIGI